MDDQNATADEARRNAQHEAIKSHVQSDVNADIERKSEHASEADRSRSDEVAGHLRGKAIDEVASKDQEVARARGMARSSQVVDYVFSIVYGLLLIRLGLALVAARSTNGFVKLIGAVTEPLYALFRGIVSSPSTEGGYTLAVPIIIAIIVYALLHMAIKAFMRMMSTRRTSI